MKKAGSQFLIFFLFILSTYATVLIVMNSVEVVTKTDLRYFHSVDRFSCNNNLVNLNQFIKDKDNINDDNIQQLQLGSSNDIGKPLTIKIPSENVNLGLIQANQNDEGLLAQANKGNYIVKGDNYSQPKSIFIYMFEGWRTMNETSFIDNKTNIFVDTNREWRYMFRTKEVLSLGPEDRYIIPEEGTNLVLLVEDKLSKSCHLVIADFVNVQSI